jgi:IMP dehydrogenase
MGNKDAFFERVWETEFRALGYEDLSMRTEQVNDIDFDEVDTTSQITRNVSVKTPVFGAAMNCISEAEMAIAMGEEGGGAFIHHANTLDEQRRMVRNVKLHLNGRIESPTTAQQDMVVANVLEDLENRERTYRTLPVTDSDGKFVGLVTQTQFKLFRSEANTAKVKDIMIPASEVTTLPAGSGNKTDDEMHQDAYQLMRETKHKILPVLNEDGTVNSLYLTDDLLRVIEGNPDDYALDSNGRLLTFASVPANAEEAVERVKAMEKYIDVVTIDTSHGENQRAFSALTALKGYIKTVKELKESFANIEVIAGNVSTASTARELAKAEPDGIKIGQGPGQICVSSDRLGIGTPQASAVYECSQAVRKVDPTIPVCADGGIKDSADTVKALALGAASVMVGSLVAGTEEQPVPVMTDQNGTSYKEYWGMGSERAQRAFAASRQRYGHDGHSGDGVIFSEGKVIRVPLKGSASDVIKEHMLGVRISMGSQGFRSIDEIQKGVSLERGN